ncbi:MAG TPA: disulfide bond formation protein DsbA [Vibrio sp.]|uniref:DsbA family protein n=1 Tax=Pseudomonas sp. C27(2019) TaxID=2604941 RepID=UPI000E8762F5|nr:DsbA family protein [Pseudomonas sp. C27(2019)]QEY59281.1 DsbA family protein [Pseudomonas sp. C27(2019)]HAS61442.1 disulfide bond formation protein DsbA [Vibrio sp.]
MHSAQLIYILDPMCSWCWGFNPVLQQILKQAQATGLKVTLRVGGLRTGQQAVLDESKRAYILQHWHRVAETTGQPFNFANALPYGFVYDTEPACRALVVARQLNENFLFTFLDNLQRAFYQDRQDITRASVLRDLAVQSGYPQDAFSEAFDSEESQVATQADFTWVRNLAIRGFPSVLAEHQQNHALITNGYQPYTAFEPLLSRWISINVSS